jgi:hypothetical protein
MTIHFSPYLDSGHHSKPSEKTADTGTHHLGTQGLLEQLELRAGLTRRTPSDEAREASYHETLAAFIRDCPENGSLIADAFSRDGLAVSTELLGWRDTLVLAGWHSDVKGVSGRLDLLAQVEACLPDDSPVRHGISDRWRAVTGYDAPLLGTDWTVNVHFPEELLPKYLLRVLDKLKAEGVGVHFITDSDALAPLGTDLHRAQLILSGKPDPGEYKGDGTLRILGFHGHAEALDWLSTQELGEHAVVVSADRFSLSETLASAGRPWVGASLSDGNPEVAQLFKLGCSLFERPVNVQNLMAYLRIYPSPLQFKLRSGLRRVLAQTGGIDNEDWRKVLKAFLEPEGEELDRKERKKRKDAMAFLPLGHEGASSLAATGVELDQLRTFVSKLGTWAVQRGVLMRSDYTGSANPELVLPQLSAISSFCTALDMLLRQEKESHVTSDRLRELVLTVYRPKTYPFSSAQLGSCDVIGSPACIVGAASQVYWSDCFEGTPSATEGAFLSQREHKGLQDKDVELTAPEIQVRAELQAQRLAVLRCSDSLTLLTAKSRLGKAVGVHPLVTELTSRCAVPVIPPPAIANDHLRNIAPSPLPEVAVHLELGTDVGVRFKPRATESYSSMEKLIQNPFDYAMEYLVKLRDADLMKLDDRERIIGNVAHRLFDNLALAFDNDPEHIQIAVDDDEVFAAHLNQAAYECGALLLMEENKLELSRVRVVLRSSFTRLLNIIRDNNLSIEGCELEYDGQLTYGVEMRAHVDLVLNDANGKKVILDLKWTKRESSYRKRILDNTELQLAVYRQMAGPQNVAATGYFMLNQGKLLSVADFQGADRIEAPGDEGLMEKALNSYRYRWTQFQKGRLEVADGLPMQDIPYQEDTVGEGLFPLKTFDGKTKGNNTFGVYKTFKGQTK